MFYNFSCHRIRSMKVIVLNSGTLRPSSLGDCEAELSDVTSRDVAQAA